MSCISKALEEVGTPDCLPPSLQTFFSLPRLACQAMRQLHPEAIAAIQSKALFSKAEEQLLSKVGSVRLRELGRVGAELPGKLLWGCLTAWKHAHADRHTSAGALVTGSSGRAKPGSLGSHSCHFFQLLVGMGRGGIGKAEARVRKPRLLAHTSCPLDEPAHLGDLPGTAAQTP